MGSIVEDLSRTYIGYVTGGWSEIIPAVASAAGFDSGGAGPIKLIDKVFSPGKQPIPRIPRLPQIRPITGETAAETTERARKFLAQQAERRGRQSTVLTSPLGLTETPPVGRRTLLGR